MRPRRVESVDRICKFALWRHRQTLFQRLVACHIAASIKDVSSWNQQGPIRPTACAGSLEQGEYSRTGNLARAGFREVRRELAFAATVVACGGGLPTVRRITSTRRALGTKSSDATPISAENRRVQTPRSGLEGQPWDQRVTTWPSGAAPTRSQSYALTAM